MSTDQSFVGSYTPTSLYNLELERAARLERDLAAAQERVRDQGLTLACLCDGILGEDADDRSDSRLVRVGCRMKRELATLREERDLWEAKCHELIAPHYILNPDLRAAKFREALRFHPVLNLKAQATIDAARKEAAP